MPPHAGLSPEFQANEDNTKVSFQIFNCPFKEIAVDHIESICQMHAQYLKGMFSCPIFRC